MMPFISFYTPTYRRPHALRRCMESVHAQTIVEAIEHVIVADYVGRGVDGMYAEVPKYVDALHGDYVYFLADDDVLAAPNVVELVRNIAEENDRPGVILVRVIKGGLQLPLGRAWPPVCGRFDLGCMVVRRDVWTETVTAGGYGLRYEGDFDFANALYRRGERPIETGVLFMTGAVMRGAAEEPELVPAGRFGDHEQ